MRKPGSGRRMVHAARRLTPRRGQGGDRLARLCSAGRAISACPRWIANRQRAPSWSLRCRARRRARDTKGVGRVVSSASWSEFALVGLSGVGGDAGVARDWTAETVYQRGHEPLWESTDSLDRQRGGEAGQMVGHRRVGAADDRPGHLQAELTGGTHAHELLLHRGTRP